ncbi:hypothetical protein ABPG75_010905 [Micractinium tetrahymenae]
MHIGGTNLAEQLLAQNLDPARPAPADPAEHAHTLLVVPVRNPYDWVMALRQMCYCCMKMQQLGFADFVQQPYAPDLFKRDAGSGLPCTSDVNIRNRTAFGSVIDMRAAKLRGLFGLGRQLGVPVEVTRLEDMLQPEGQAAFVQQLASKYGLPLVGEAGQAAGSAQPAHVQQPGSGSAAADARRLSEGGAQTARKDPAPPLEPVLVQPRNGTGAGGSPAGRASGVVSPSIVTLQGTDARWFVKRTFTALSRVSSSLYLNEVQLARHWGSLAPGIQALNRQLDWELEEQLGYHPLQQAQQATLDRAAKELEAEREAARRQATYAATVQAARRQSSRLPASKAVVVAGQAGPRVFCGGIPAQRGATLRTAMLEAGVTPHNGRATLINCRGLGSCGTCAVEVRGPVEPAGWTAQERLRLNFPPHGPPGNARLRLACQVACQGDLAVVKRTQFWGQGEEVVPDFPDATAGAAGTAGTAGTAAAAEVMPLGQLEFVLDRRRQRG